MLTPWKESYNPPRQHVENQRHYFPTKVHLVKVMVFPVVIYGCESCTVKKAECWRIDAFELWCWRRLLRVPWTAKISNQSILKEISPGCSLEGMMLKLKLQYFGYLMWRVDSLEKTLMLGGIGGRRKRGRQRMRWLNGITDSMDMGLGWLREMVMDREAWRAGFMGSQRVGHDWVTELNWTEFMKSVQLKRGRMFRIFMFAWVCIEPQRWKDFWGCVEDQESWLDREILESKNHIETVELNKTS